MPRPTLLWSTWWCFRHSWSANCTTRSKTPATLLIAPDDFLDVRKLRYQYETRQNWCNRQKWADAPSTASTLFPSAASTVANHQIALEDSQTTGSKLPCNESDPVTAPMALWHPPTAFPKGDSCHVPLSRDDCEEKICEQPAMSVVIGWWPQRFVLRDYHNAPAGKCDGEITCLNQIHNIYIYIRRYKYSSDTVCLALALAPSYAALHSWCLYIMLSKSYLPRRCDWKDGFFNKSPCNMLRAVPLARVRCTW